MVIAVMHLLFLGNCLLVTPMGSWFPFFLFIALEIASQPTHLIPPLTFPGGVEVARSLSTTIDPDIQGQQSAARMRELERQVAFVKAQEVSLNSTILGLRAENKDLKTELAEQKSLASYGSLHPYIFPFHILSSVVYSFSVWFHFVTLN